MKNGEKDNNNRGLGNELKWYAKCYREGRMMMASGGSSDSDTTSIASSKVTSPHGCTFFEDQPSESLSLDRIRFKAKNFNKR